MCRPVINSWSRPPVLRPAPHRTMSGLGFRRAVYAKNGGSVAVAAGSPARVKNNVNVCTLGGGGGGLGWAIGPLPFPAPVGFALVVLTVSNVNEVQDDTWDFLVNGEVVATYDGGGETTLVFSQYLPIGQTYHLTANNTADNGSGNYFTVDLSVDGESQINTDSINGGVGTTFDLGTFTT